MMVRLRATTRLEKSRFFVEVDVAIVSLFVVDMVALVAIGWCVEGIHDVLRLWGRAAGLILSFAIAFGIVLCGVGGGGRYRSGERGECVAGDGQNVEARGTLNHAGEIQRVRVTVVVGG